MANIMNVKERFMNKVILLLMLPLLMGLSAKAQVFDYVYKKQISDKGLYTNYKRPIVYNYEREADMQFNKRVWREIDLREKQNLPLYYPVDLHRTRISLFQLLQKYIATGDIYAFADEEFLVQYDKAKVKSMLFMCDSLEEHVVIPETGEDSVIIRWVCDSTSIYRKVLKYRLKEDWFFDKQRSVMECRIIGICAYEMVERDDEFFPKELFWVSFEQCRPFFANHEVYNTKNDVERMTYDDLFMKRRFSSSIVKESNVYDREINEYTKGLSALLESDRVKDDIYKYEHDLWHF